MKTITPLLPPATAAATTAANGVPGTAASVETGQAALEQRTAAGAMPEATHTRLPRGGFAVHQSIIARRSVVESGIQGLKRLRADSSAPPNAQSSVSGARRLEGHGLLLSENGIAPTGFNRLVYERALGIEGREIALGLGGVLVDNIEQKRDPHRIVQRLFLKPGAEALLLGLREFNSLSLYTHEPALRVSCILEAFPALRSVFLDDGGPGPIDEQVVRKAHRIVCLENQMEAMNNLLRKVQDGATLLEWESGLLQSLRHEDVDMVRLANLRSRHLATSLKKADFDVVVSVERQAWRPQFESNGAAMLLMPGRTGIHSEAPKDASLLKMLTALRDTRENAAVAYVERGQMIEGEETREADVELPARHVSPVIAEFQSRVRMLRLIDTQYANIAGRNRSG